MKRSEAEALGVDLLELANVGAWAEQVAMDLSADALEILRRKAQLHTRITSMEREERLLWEMLLLELVQQSAAATQRPRTNDGASDPQQATADLARA